MASKSRRIPHASFLVVCAATLWFGRAACAEESFWVEADSSVAFIAPQGVTTVQLEYPVYSGIDYRPRFNYWDTSNCDNFDEAEPRPPRPFSFTVTDITSGATAGSAESVGPTVVLYDCPCPYTGATCDHPEDTLVVSPERRDIDISNFTRTGDASMLVTAIGNDALVTLTNASPPTFAFELPGTLPAQRVLTHKYRSDDDYPLAGLQIPTPPTARPRVLIRGSVEVNGSGASRDIYFRLLDPPDSSTYVPSADRIYGDNADSAVGRGRLYVQDAAGNYILDPSGNPVTNDADGVLKTTSRADGGVTLVLETTDRYAGDNYRIEASFDRAADFDSPEGAQTCATCPRSAEYTAWKRIYVETSIMFRRGSFIAGEVPIGARHILVDDIHTHFGPPGTRHLVRLMHAPMLRANSGAPPDLDRFYSEDHHVVVVGAGTPDALVPEAHLALEGDAMARHQYVLDRSGRRPEEQPLLRDAVAVVGIGDTFVPSFGSLDTAGKIELQKFFDTMFVDLFAVPESGGYVPHIRNMQLPNGYPGSTARRVADKWSSTAIRQTDLDDALAPPNLIHIAGGAHPATRPPGTVNGEIGLTSVHDGGNSSWSWVGNIERLTARPFGPLRGMNAERVNFENVAHELVHQWKVNEPTPPPPSSVVGHCAFDAASGSGTFCRMHEPWIGDPHRLERGDGQIELHYEIVGGAPHSEYLQIRRGVEPKANN